MTQAVLSVQELCVEFPSPRGTVRAVRDVTFDVAVGEIVGVVGESGCGKTVTALSVLGLIPPPGRVTSGRILVEGRDVVGMSPRELQELRGSRAAMVFQDPMTSLNPVLRIGTQIEEAMLAHRGYDRRRAQKRALELLAQVEVPEPERRASSYPYQFSGGMRQRVVTAMGLANHPPLLIADEPTTALDVTVQAQIMTLLRKLNSEYGMALLLITHNIALVSSLCARVLVMYAGQIVEAGPTREVLRSPQHPYTWMLMRAVPDLDTPRGRQLINIEGSPPELDVLPSGCSFHPRCPHALEQCRVEDPPPAPGTENHLARCWVLMRNVTQGAPGPAKTRSLPAERSLDESPLLQVIEVHKEYLVGGSFGRARVLRAVDGATIAVQPGETLGLVGESGSGKSTLARLILQLERPTRGRISFQDQNLTTMAPNDLRRIRRHMQIIFQDPYASLDPRMTVGDIIGEPLANFGWEQDGAQQRIVEVMELCGLSRSLIDRFPHTFSGGQRQRIAIARAIALNPDFVVADEPVSALDVSIQAQIINLMADLQAELSLTYLFISHDLSVVRHVSDRVAVMYFGSIIETGKVEAVYGSPLHPYTSSLLSSVPRIDPDAEAQRLPVTLRGEMPSPLDPPTGCPFHTRCPIAQFPLCSRERPLLEAKRFGHDAACHFPQY